MVDGCVDTLVDGCVDTLFDTSAEDYVGGTTTTERGRP